MNIDDIGRAVELKRQMDNIKEAINDIENDPDVELKVTKPFKYSCGEVTLYTLSDDCKGAIIEQLKKELKEIECEIRQL